MTPKDFLKKYGTHTASHVVRSLYSDWPNPAPPQKLTLGEDLAFDLVDLLEHLAEDQAC